jgi:hypothetical protein
MNVFEHFACHTNLPVKLRDVKDHIIEADTVDKIVRVPADLSSYILYGGYHKYRDIESDERIALIGYPRDMSQGMQRLVTIKEMLHTLDPHEATAPTTAKVEQLIDDLLVQGAGNSIGLPAFFDRRALLKALCILLPRDALDERRPAYKKDPSILHALAKEAVIPPAFVEIALRDDWAAMLDAL